MINHSTDGRLLLNCVENYNYVFDVKIIPRLVVKYNGKIYRPIDRYNNHPNLCYIIKNRNLKLYTSEVACGNNTFVN